MTYISRRLFHGFSHEPLHQKEVWEWHVYWVKCCYNHLFTHDILLSFLVSYFLSRIGNMYPMYSIALVFLLINLLVSCRPSTFDPNFHWDSQPDDLTRGFFCEGTPATKTSYWASLFLTIAVYILGLAVTPFWPLNWWMGECHWVGIVLRPFTLHHFSHKLVCWFDLINHTRVLLMVFQHVSSAQCEFTDRGPLLDSLPSIFHLLLLKIKGIINALLYFRTSTTISLRSGERRPLDCSYGCLLFLSWIPSSLWLPGFQWGIWKGMAILMLRLGNQLR